MKYMMMLIAVALAFITATQISSARGFHTRAALTGQHDTSWVDSLTSEWLVPDSARRMLAYHKAFKQ